MFELLGASRARERVLIGKIDRKRTAYDRLDPHRRHLVGEFERAEHVVGVGERQRGLAVSLGEFAQPRDRQRALEQGIGRVHVQMDEAGHSTPRFLMRCECEGAERALSTAVAVLRARKMRLIPSPLVAMEALSSSASAVAPLHSVAMTCAQIAIMPKNSASDASVAASSTRARTMISHSPSRNKS